MTDLRTTAKAFHAAAGVEDWRVLFTGAHAYYRVASFTDAAVFVAAIADVAEAVGHSPDVDVRPDGVTIRTASGEYVAPMGDLVISAPHVLGRTHVLPVHDETGPFQPISVTSPALFELDPRTEAGARDEASPPGP